MTSLRYDGQFSTWIEQSVPADLLEVTETRFWEESETRGERDTFSRLLENLTLFRDRERCGEPPLRKSWVLLVVLPPLDLSRGVRGKNSDFTFDRRFCLVLSAASSGLSAPL